MVNQKWEELGHKVKLLAYISHQLDERSRVNREIHARICGSVGVKFLCATRPDHRIRHGPNNKEDLNVSAIDLLAARLSFAKFLSLGSIRHSGKWGKCRFWLPNCMDHKDGKKYLLICYMGGLATR